MKLYTYIGICFILLASAASGQGILNDQPKMLFSNEQTVGGFLNSNGIGLNYRFARYIDARHDQIFEAQFDYVKHPKEYKSVVSTEWYTRRFVFGKENLFWELKGFYGSQNELYRKYDFSSISIRAFYAGGISLGFLKPIYYEVFTFNSLGQSVATEYSKFDPGIHLYNYGGIASFTKGLNELKLVPGLTVKAGVNFEYSEREPIVHAIEAGLGFTLYPRKIEIMASDDANFWMFNMFVGYRFGTLLDISDVARAKSWKERRKERQEAIPDGDVIGF